jgi:exopolyphosphatase/guanosine-5'-triphosphate,3'-diphosphate pyrophosphatase
MKSYIFGGIDIGSNAMRLLITQVFKYKDRTKFRKISYTRFPIRLGLDVFESGTISPKKKEQLIKALQAYKLLLDIHEVDDFRACATSAMRDAKNGAAIIETIKAETGINLETISGEEEANLIYSQHLINKLGKKQNCIYIDVGGGSTDISIFADHKKVISKSFKIGTIRMKLNTIDQKEWLGMETWLKEMRRQYKFKYCIGTGGNINKVAKLLKHKEHSNHFFYLKDIHHLQEKLEDMTNDERIIKFKLKPDRSDVITNAIDIYTSIMKKTDIEEIHIPKIGLADGMIRQMYLDKKAANLVS